MSDIKIRLASLEDAASIALLTEQLGYTCSEMEVVERLAELLQQANHAIYLATLPEGKIIAWMHLYVYHSLISAPLVMVGGLIVDAAYRDLGIGLRLVNNAEDWGCARGCEAIYLKSNVIREEAHVFYEKMGFENIKTQYAFRKEMTV